jgi:hypothetical protein
VFVGLVLFVALAACTLYTTYFFLLEPRQGDGTFSLTWRSDTAIVLLLFFSQAISFPLFRIIKLIRHKKTAIAIAGGPILP